MKYYQSVLRLLFCFALIAPGRISPAQIPAKQYNPQLDEADLVHSGDVIDVDVVGGFEFDWRGTLTAEGFLAGMTTYGDSIYGLCRSETQIAADVAKALSKILRDPKVVVRIIDRSGRAVALLEGAVKTPARFRLMRPTHLRELIVLAGGLTDDASGDITLLRPSGVNCAPAAGNGGAGVPGDNGLSRISIKIGDILSGKPEADPQILSGDLITVERALPVYVIGAVNNPRPIYSRSELTVTRAIASAGGLAKGADPQKVTIFRRDGVESKSIEVDLFKIKRGEIVDEVLKPFDIIDAAPKGGGKRKYPPVAAGEKRDRGAADLPLRVVD